MYQLHPIQSNPIQIHQNQIHFQIELEEPQFLIMPWKRKFQISYQEKPKKVFLTHHIISKKNSMRRKEKKKKRIGVNARNSHTRIHQKKKKDP